MMGYNFVYQVDKEQALRARAKAAGQKYQEKALAYTTYVLSDLEGGEELPWGQLSTFLKQLTADPEVKEALRACQRHNAALARLYKDRQRGIIDDPWMEISQPHSFANFETWINIHDLQTHLSPKGEAEISGAFSRGDNLSFFLLQKTDNLKNVVSKVLFRTDPIAAISSRLVAFIGPALATDPVLAERLAGLGPKQSFVIKKPKTLIVPPSEIFLISPKTKPDTISPEDIQILRKLPFDIKAPDGGEYCWWAYRLRVKGDDVNRCQNAITEKPLVLAPESLPG